MFLEHLVIGTTLLASPNVYYFFRFCQILPLQPYFLEQRSRVQEVIGEAGHLCIFPPKFHCELNFIEYFWGPVEKYIQDNCDYTFETWKQNIKPAMGSV